jgi:hypothetical protein
LHSGAGQEEPMGKLIATFTMAMALAACSKSGGGMDGKLKEFEGYRDRMCKCTEADCANQVLEDWRAWRKGTTDLKMTDDQKQKSKAINAAFWDCKRKAAPDGDDE